MVSTRLEILNQSQAISKDIPISINFVLADVREPDKRNASFSKTISLYATNEVNKLFENIFEVNISTQYFNKNLKTPVKYFVNELLNFEGDLQLIKINLLPDGNIVYECSIIGAGGSVFVEIGEKYITGNVDSSEDLDFSAYDHTYDRDTQIATRSNLGSGLDILYPFIDRGTNGGSDTQFSVTDFLPCFTVYEYVTKILANAGYTFTSSILSSSLCKNTVVTPNLISVPLSLSQLQNRQFYVGLGSDVSLGSPGTNYINHTDESTPFFDLGSQYSSGVATLNDSGNYNVAISQKIKLNFTHTDATVTYMTARITLAVYIQYSSDGGTTWNTANVNGIFIKNPLVPVLAGYATFNKATDYFDTNEVATGDTFYPAGTKFRHAVVQVYAIVPRYYNASNVEITTGTGTINISLLSGALGTSFYALATGKNVMAGNTIEVNNALPSKIKQKDLFKSIIQAFNLYVDIDKTNNNNLIIESYDDFYNDAIINYENRTDLDKEQTINPNLLEGKSYIYSYKSDKDFYNDLYLTTHNENFGTEQVDIENDFIKSDKKTEVIFSPTPNVANYGLGIAHPRIYTKDGTTIKPLAANIRLLYVGGVKQTSVPYTYTDTTNAVVDLLTNDYLYAGHTDDPFNPTLDLNFGLPKEVYYSYPAAYFTNNNLYNRFYLSYINNITSKDSKFVTKYLWLSSKDINEFNFRNRWFIDGAYYIVNKIVDYNPLNETSTKVELIKLLDTQVFTPTTFRLADSPLIDTGSFVNNGLDNSSLSLGDGNQNRGLNSVAIGNNIVIPATCNNVTVIGNNITIPENTTNFSYINGKIGTTIYGQSGTVITVNSDYNQNTLEDLILIDATSNDVNVQLENVFISNLYEDISFNSNGTDITGRISKIVTIKRIDNSAFNVNILSGIGNIDGNTSMPLLTKESLTLQFDGANWNII
jgi:hypothetical protein